MVVATAPTSTTNITGLRSIRRGFNFAMESHKARPSRLVSINELDRDCGLAVIEGLKRLSGKHLKMFKNWSETQDWKKRQSSNDYNGGHQQCGKERSRYRKCAGGFRNGFFASKVSSNRQNRNNGEEAPKKRGEANR